VGRRLTGLIEEYWMLTLGSPAEREERKRRVRQRQRHRERKGEKNVNLNNKSKLTSMQALYTRSFSPL
jgi:hypothetical protein